MAYLVSTFTLQEKEEKLDGDAALNKFFRDIYQDADEDTRRAMRKSFVRHLFIKIKMFLAATSLEVFICWFSYQYYIYYDY